VLLVAALTLSGCAAGSMTRAQAEGNAEGMAAPGPDLVGTWRGTAFAVPGANYGVSTPVEITIGPDGTWSWTKGGQRQAGGRVWVQGGRVVFDEGTASKHVKANELQRRGDHLWGVSHTFMPGWMSAVDLRRQS
jgi:hypothetical protein